MVCTYKYIELDSDFRNNNLNESEYHFTVCTDINNLDKQQKLEGNYPDKREPVRYEVTLLELILPPTYEDADGATVRFDTHDFVYVRFNNLRKHRTYNYMSMNSVSKDTQFRMSIQKYNNDSLAENRISMMYGLTEMMIDISLSDDLEFEIVIPNGTKIFPDTNLINNRVNALFKLTINKKKLEQNLEQGEIIPTQDVEHVL